MSRKIFIGGNWKCNGTKNSVKKLINILNYNITSSYNAEIVVAPPFLYLNYVISNIKNQIQVSSQDVSNEKGYGAFTGEITPEMIYDFGIPWTIIGHSERRHKVTTESNHFIASKVKNALDVGLKVIICIGELLEEREKNKTLEICINQLTPIVEIISPKYWNNIVIAYEPVWAIGTGVIATPEQAENIHSKIRQWINNKLGNYISDSIRIIYGGSVKSTNCRNLIDKKNIDGFLIGGASINEEFIQIINNSVKLK